MYVHVYVSVFATIINLWSVVGLQPNITVLAFHNVTCVHNVAFMYICT